MYVSIFAHWRTTTPPGQADLDFETFRREILLNGPQAFDGAKEETPAFSPTEYPPGVTRSKDAAISVSALVLDYDDLPAEKMAAVLEYLQGLEHVIYSTYSHGKKFRLSGGYSFRVVLPLSKPVPASEWLGFWLRAQSLLPVPSDPSCKDPSRIYGLPYCPPLDVPNAFYEYHEGAVLPVDQVLALELPEGLRIGAPGSASGVRGPRTQLTSDRIEIKLVKAHGRALQRKRFAEEVQLGVWIEAVAKGDVWTHVQGERHQAMLKCTIELERKFPLASIEALTAIWERSVTAVLAEDSTWDPNQRLEDVRRAYEGARRERIQYQSKRKADAAEARSRAIAQARGDGQTREYDAKDLERLREFAGLKPGRDLDKHWVRTLDKTAYVLTLAGYSTPRTSRDVLQVCRDVLPPAGVSTSRRNEEGDETVVQLNNFLHDHSTPLAGIVADMTCPDGSYVDEEDVMHEAVCRVREIEPLFDPTVDEYLRLVGGKHAEKLLDWLASFLDLSRQTCALYFKGPKGTGKTLIPTMLAAMFHGRPAPTELESILNNFNAYLTSCPLVFADEEAKAGGMQELTSAKLRSLIGSDRRLLKRKFLSDATIKGAIRLILSANNSTMLRFEKEEPTADDLDAVNERFLCITTTEETERWLEQHGGYALTESWVAGAFEQHVMWLAQNRKVVAGKRWLVEGEPSEVQSITATSNEINSAVCQWIASYLNNPKQVDLIAPGCVQFDERGVHVNSSGVLKSFDTVVHNSNARATIENVGTALRALSYDKKERFTTQGLRKVRLKFHRIRMDLIRDWAERNDFGDAEVLRTADERPGEFLLAQAN